MEGIPVREGQCGDEDLESLQRNILQRVTFETALSFTFLNPVIQRDLCKWKLCPSKMIREVKLGKENRREESW